MKGEKTKTNSEPSNLEDIVNKAHLDAQKSTGEGHIY